jgi:hypothetical protein
MCLCFFSKIFLPEFFFRESRLCTWPPFSHFVTNLDWLASQPIHFFFSPDFCFVLFQIFYVFLPWVNPVGDNCMMMKVSAALAPAPSSHCCTHHHHCHCIVIVTAQPHLWRNPVRRRKRQKSLFLFTAQQIEKSESGPSF